MAQRDSASSIQTVAVTTPGNQAAPRRPQIEAVVLLIDRSASMRRHDYPPSRLEATKQAALAFFDAKRTIDLRDRLAVVEFADIPRLVVDFGAPLDVVRRRVATIDGGGSTAIGDAMDYAITLLAQPTTTGTTRRIVILSDGGTNTGLHPRDLVGRCRETQVIVDAVGIGSVAANDYHRGEGLLRELAAATGGTFVYCRDTGQLLAHYRQLAAKKWPAHAAPNGANWRPW